jgi:hypothetical protein
MFIRRLSQSYLLQYKYISSSFTEPKTHIRTVYLIYISLLPCFLWDLTTGWSFFTPLCNCFIVSMNRKGWRIGILEAGIKNCFLYSCVLSLWFWQTLPPQLFWETKKKKRRKKSENLLLLIWRKNKTQRSTQRLRNAWFSLEENVHEFVATTPRTLLIP